MFKFILILPVAFLLNGCAGVLPVPGGGESINNSFYKTETDLKTRVQSIKQGMPKNAVFTKLSLHEDQFILLTREEIMSTLYGGQKLEFTQNQDAPLSERSFIQSLTGYKLLFKNVNRKHGLTSPIRIKTQENGFSYTAIFIFKDGILYEDPVLSGGEVDTTSSKTLFDYMNPSMIIGRVL